MSDSEEQSNVNEEEVQAAAPISTEEIEDMLSDKEKFLVIGGGTFTTGVPSVDADTGPDFYDAFLLDMDGVLHRTGQPIDGAADFLHHLRNSKQPFILLTNECRYTNQYLADHLKDILGVGPNPDEIYSAANSARDFFARLLRHGFDGSVYIVGEEGLIENIQSAYKKAKKAKVYSKNDEIDDDAPLVNYVVIGSVHEENTRYSERAAEFVRQGARLVYTCPDWFDRSHDGKLAFGMPMPLVQLIQKTVGCGAYNMGKPNSHMIRMALKKLMESHNELKWKDVLFVGDSIGTDIRTAIENGIDCALVMSGTTTPEKLKSSALQPNFVFPSIKELHAALKEKDEKVRPTKPSD